LGLPPACTIWYTHMMEYRVELSTTATPAAVWEAFVDVERWPVFTASIRQVRRLDDGPLREGSTARVKQPGMPWAKWTVTTVEPVRSFTWQTTAPGLTTIGDHELSSSGDVTHVALTLRQRGPLAGIVGSLFGRRLRRFVDLEARGLVAAAEAAHISD